MSRTFYGRAVWRRWQIIFTWRKMQLQCSATALSQGHGSMLRDWWVYWSDETCFRLSPIDTWLINAIWFTFSWQVRRVHVRPAIYSRLRIWQQKMRTPHASAKRAMLIGRMVNAIALIHAVHVWSMNFCWTQRHASRIHAEKAIYIIRSTINVIASVNRGRVISIKSLSLILPRVHRSMAFRITVFAVAKASSRISIKNAVPTTSHRIRANRRREWLK